MAEYADYVLTEHFQLLLEEVREISPEVAASIEKHGIGTELLENGDYDFESGQLLESLPQEFCKRINDSKTDSTESNLYDLIADIANDYADFCENP